MLWLLVAFNGSVQAFASSNGLLGISTTYNLIKKPSYTLNLGISSLNYRGYSYNFATFDMKMKIKGLTIQVYGNLPVNNLVKFDRAPFKPVR